MSSAADVPALFDIIHASGMPEELRVALYFYFKFSLTPVHPSVRVLLAVGLLWNGRGGQAGDEGPDHPYSSGEPN